MRSGESDARFLRRRRQLAAAAGVVIFIAGCIAWFKLATSAVSEVRFSGRVFAISHAYLRDFPFGDAWAELIGNSGQIDHQHSPLRVLLPNTNAELKDVFQRDGLPADAGIAVELRPSSYMASRFAAIDKLRSLPGVFVRSKFGLLRLDFDSQQGTPPRELAGKGGVYLFYDSGLRSKVHCGEQQCYHEILYDGVLFLTTFYPVEALPLAVPIQEQILSAFRSFEARK